jgi:hypothetical protein
MMKRLNLLVFLCFFSIPAAAAAGGPNMEPGRWEITTKSRMQGMDIPASTITQCLTEDDMVPRDNAQPGQDCEITDVTTSGDTVRWYMRCGGQGEEVESRGEIRYDGNSFEGHVTTEIGDTGMTVESTMTGKRVGDCN